MKFSLSALFVLILAAALGVAAITQATRMWEQVVFTLTLVGLISATIGSVSCSTRTRAFCVGCSIAGWTYFLVAKLPFGNDWLDQPGVPLVTSRLATLLEKRLFADSVVTHGLLPIEELHTIVHCLWTWIFAASGGLLSVYCHLRAKPN